MSTTRIAFDEKLTELKHQLLEMGNVVIQMLEMSIKSLDAQDVKLANEAINMDDIVDKYNIDIEASALQLLALQQPMARDLRLIVAALRIITDVERMGDYAVDIAKAAIRLSDKPLFKPLIDIPKMASVVEDMLRKALEGFATDNLETVQLVVLEDDIVDGTYRALYDELIDYMENDPSLIRRAVPLIMISRYLERIADHITNVCERIFYVETGELKELHY